MKARLFICLALLACACTPSHNDLQRFDLNCIVKEINVQADTLGLPWKAEFNRFGQLTRMTLFEYDGTVHSINEYSYSCCGVLKGMKELNAAGETVSSSKYVFDGDFLSENRAFDANGAEERRWVQENDGEHIVRSEYYLCNELIHVTTREFSGDSYTEDVINDEGELLRHSEVEFFLKEDKPTHIISEGVEITVEYNEEGLPIKSHNAVLNSVGTLQWAEDLGTNPDRYYSYEYDEHGNWTVRYTRNSPDSQDCTVIRRTIKY